MNVVDIFPGRIAITPQEAGLAVLGQTRQTTNNQLHEGRFKLPLTDLSGKRMVLLDELQEYIEGCRGKKPKRRGPKTKAERLAMQAN